MELKHQFAAVTNGLDLLLIVPYGIETYYTKQLYLKLKQLLIVPYGIETAIQRARLNNLTAF